MNMVIEYFSLSRIRNILCPAFAVGMAFSMTFLSAQTRNTDQLVARPTVTIEPVVMLDRKMADFYYLDKYSQYQSVRVSQHRPGVKLDIQREEGGVSFYQERMVDGEKSMEKAMTFPLTKGTNSAYIFFYATATGEPQMRVLEDSRSIHPPHTVRFLNLTNAPALGMVDSQTYQLRPGQELITPVVGNNSFRFLLSYAMQHNDEFKQYTPVKMYKFQGDDSRMLVIISFLQTSDGGEAGSAKAKYWRPYMTSTFTTPP